MDLTEKGLHWLMWIPYFAHFLAVLSKVHSHDASIQDKDMTKHASRSYDIKTNHVIVYNFELHRFKYCYDMLFEFLLRIVLCFECCIVSSHLCLYALI